MRKEMEEEAMTTITKEEAQAVADLKAGYTLGNADVEILQRLARIALAALTTEPVAWIVHTRTGDQLTTDGNYVANAEGILGLHSTPLYTTPPALVPVLDERAAAPQQEAE